MTREELLRSKEYWILELQTGLYRTLEQYRKSKNFNKSELAKELGFNKSYITQVLNGDFDHKISKFVELSLASGKAPIISFIDLDSYIQQDAMNESFTAVTPTIEYVTFNELSQSEKCLYQSYNPNKYNAKTYSVEINEHEPIEHILS